MGRGAGGGRGGGFRARRKATSGTSSKPAKAAKAPPAPMAASTLAGSRTALGESVADGIGLGLGMNMADNIMGPRAVKVQTDAPAAAAQSGMDTNTTLGGSNSCFDSYKSFMECLSSNGSDIGRCQYYMDMLNVCRRMNTSSVSGGAAAF